MIRLVKTMTEIKVKFLTLSVIKQMKYADIEKELGVSGSQLTQWWNELKVEREALSKNRKIWRKKFENTDFWDFNKWYTESERKCCYCDITEPEIKELIKAQQITTKRLTTRGRRLEIERKEPNQPYDNIENLVFSCYWCNNAKSDEFTFDEFLEIGKQIGKIWKQRKLKLNKAR